MAIVNKTKSGAKNAGQLKKEVRQNATITTTINEVFVNGDSIDFDFAAALSGPEDTELDTVITNHTPSSSIVDTYTAAITLHEEDMLDLIYADTQGGAFTITLPPAANYKEKWVTFINKGNNNNSFTLDGNGSDKINSANSVVLKNDESITIMSDGTEWRSNAKDIIKSSQDTIIKSEATQSTTWVSWGCFSYDPAYVTLTAMQVVAWKSIDGGASQKGDIRLYDVDNSQVICSIANIGATTKSIFSDNSAANLPTNTAMFEVQFSIQNAASELTLESVTLIFD